MDRTFTKSARRLLLVFGTIAAALMASGCSKMRTYRAQSSPLPLPSLGLLNRSEVRLGMDTDREPNRTRVAANYSNAPALATPPTTLAESKSPAPVQIISSPAPITETPPQATATLTEARALVSQGRSGIAKLTTYQVPINRQERVGNSLQPAEDVVLSIRRVPRAIRLEWPDGPHKGREVIYDSGADSQIHIHTPNTLIPVPNLTISPDSPLVMRNSRHPITEAGLDVILAKVEHAFDDTTAGNSIADEGVSDTNEASRLCRKLVYNNTEGEIWTFLIDTATGFPASVLGTTSKGELLEHYKFGEVQVDPVTLADAASFNADQRWTRSRGLLGRVAGNTQAGDAAPRR